MAWSLLLPFLVVTALTLEHTSTAADGATNSSQLQVMPGCPDKCGNVSVPYPFGFGFNNSCFREGFNLTCNDTGLYLGENMIMDINLPSAEVRVQNSISATCEPGAQQPAVQPMFTPVGRFTVSTKNSLIAIGCAIVGLVYGDVQVESVSACGSFCNNGNIVNDTKCAGIGCCQASMAFSRTRLTSFKTSFQIVENLTFAFANSSPCSYAFVADAEWFKFHPSYASSNIFGQLYGDRGVPLVLDWDIGNETCSEAKSRASYACISRNSVCIDREANLRGYFCKCNLGYEGNPYLAAGCQDIDECASPSMYHCNGTCTNTDGGYYCHGTAQRRQAIGISLAIGLAGATGFILLVATTIFTTQKLRHRRAMKLKQRFFEQNRGQLLQQLVSQRADIAERMIITVDEIAKATNNFDPTRELGGGGHGTVYKGILSDLHVVAIKKSKIAVQREIDEFINEVAMLSQINHKNVVKLLGCCLETEVPLLVYEFISNGTLYHHLHVENPRSLSWSDRLSIATETANAIAYLHFSVSIPIIHRDIKSSNILLDDTLTSKVSDFGASRYIPLDRTGLTTVVQGTIGYLDPMYFYTGRLTDKSDVYSFGVLLVELLTRKKPSYLSSNGDGLVAHFVNLVGEGNLNQILDPQVMDEGGNEVQEVAKLSISCVRLKPEDRPTMRQVHLTLECLLPSKTHVGDSTMERGFEEIGNTDMDFPLTDEGQSTGQSSKWYSSDQDPLMFSGSR